MLQILFSSPLTFVVYAIALLVAISIHEFSHARAAVWLGDPTPDLQGRLTLNPRAHIDPYGLLFLLFFGFGWGKPVQFDPFNLRNPRRDAAIISIAGPISNLALASILAIVYRFSSITLLEPFIMLNVVLAIFNLLPIHPLDGFKIVGGLLSDEQARNWYSLQRYGLLFLLLLIIPIGQTNMLQSLIGPAINFVLGILLPGSGGSGII